MELKVVTWGSFPPGSCQPLWLWIMTGQSWIEQPTGLRFHTLLTWDAREARNETEDTHTHTFGRVCVCVFKAFPQRTWFVRALLTYWPAAWIKLLNIQLRPICQTLSWFQSHFNLLYCTQQMGGERASGSAVINILFFLFNSLITLLYISAILYVLRRRDLDFLLFVMKYPHYLCFCNSRQFIGLSDLTLSPSLLKVI